MTLAEKKSVEKITKEIISYLEVEGDFETTYGEDEVELALNTKDTGIVIGYHGEVLEALQLIISLCISKKIGRFIRVSVEVGDYKKNRTDYLQDLATQAKERALVEKKEIFLPSLKSWERRIVHVMLQDDKEVVSESVGEGKDRTLVIKPR